MTRAKVYAVPLVRSPLEVGRCSTKAAFERQYRVHDWRTVVRFSHAGRDVRCGGFRLTTLLREHAAAYFQLQWNAHSFVGSHEVCVGSGKRQQWRPYPVTYAPDTTLRLRICYALTPQHDTEVILHDGYGLSTRDPWWQQVPGTVVQVVPLRQRAA